jgi:hypothetical protein
LLLYFGITPEPILPYLIYTNVNIPVKEYIGFVLRLKAVLYDRFFIFIKGMLSSSYQQYYPNNKEVTPHDNKQSTQ